MSPSDNEVDNLIDGFNSKITYWQSVREDACIQIRELTKAKRTLVEHYNREDVV